MEGRGYNIRCYVHKGVIQLKKRILALLLALTVLFCGAVTFAEDDDWEDEDWGDEEFEDEEFEEEEGKTDFRTIAGYDTGEKFACGDFSYQLAEDGKSAVVISYTGTSGDVVIPDTLDGHPVIAVGEHMFQDNQVVETVQLPEGLQTIGNMAFFKCIRLRKIEIPEGITLIDQACFGGCDALEEVVLPDSLEEVGQFGFLSCSKLEAISFGPNMKAIGPGAFQLCASLKTVKLPGKDSVRIEADSFAGCAPDIQIEE